MTFFEPLNQKTALNLGLEPKKVPSEPKKSPVNHENMPLNRKKGP